MSSARVTRTTRLDAPIPHPSVAADALTRPDWAGVPPTETPRSWGDRNALLENAADDLHHSGVPAVLIHHRVGDNTVKARNRGTDTAPAIPFNARFRIGGATRAFVAVVVLQLVAERRLTLDAPVARWLPGVLDGTDHAADITVRHLLQETSGLADFRQDLDQLHDAAQFAARRFRSYRPEQLVDLALRHDAECAPGTRWRYRDINYVLLGMLVRRVTGNSWDAEVRQRIIRRLELTGTAAPGDFPFVMGPHTESYDRFPGAGSPVNTTLFNPSWADAAGSLISTTDDLGRFFRALLGGRLLGPAELAEMLRTVPARAPGSTAEAHYGLGIFWRPMAQGGGCWGHDGNILGFHHHTAVTENGDSEVVIAMNGVGEHSERLATLLVDTVLTSPAPRC
ncbi:serine hydrolase domain-containing protein [Actinoalloteichus spitiensis]|uniref:serine hydrolase domain-containing protein n=1 Tax=Actinoalloteichus spitiensis TaxID=252394 RepID=UPI000371E155|nr:serine hydrolase domain-containing protein [Actinoalloteichus spitiensis]